MVQETFVFCGKNPAFGELPFGIETPLAGIAASEGFKIAPSGGTEFLAGIVAAAGDVNGDGFGDLALAVKDDYGVSHLVFGGPRGNRDVGTPFADITKAFTFDPNNGGDGLTQEAFAIGDINGDGFDDWATTDVVGGTVQAQVIFGGRTPRYIRPRAKRLMEVMVSKFRLAQVTAKLLRPLMTSTKTVAMISWSRMAIGRRRPLLAA